MPCVCGLFARPCWKIRLINNLALFTWTEVVRFVDNTDFPVSPISPAPHILHAAARAMYAIPNGMAGNHYAKEPEHSPAVCFYQRNCAWIAEPNVLSAEFRVGKPERIDRPWHPARDGHERGKGMGTIIGCGYPKPPVVPPWSHPEQFFRRHGMVVLPFGIKHLAYSAFPVQSRHLQVVCRIGIILREHVYLPAFLHNPRQFHAFRHGDRRCAFAHHMFSRLERLNSKGGMFMEIIRHNYRVHRVVQKLAVISVRSHPVSLVDLLKFFLPLVADRHQFHTRKRRAIHE